MATAFKDRNLLAVIGDEVRAFSTVCSTATERLYAQDTITGLLLAGIGNVERGKKNFLVVDSSTFFYILYCGEHPLIVNRNTSVYHRGCIPGVYRA